jgi:very-short-patch-repair endonuclease
MAPRSLEKSCIRYSNIWSSKNILNPKEVAISSIKNYWFKCEVCPHDYEQRPGNKTNLGRGCPYCSKKKICGLLGCNFCLPRSCYIYRDIWSVCNKLRPEEVFISSGKKFYFDCNICCCIYEQSPNKKTNGHRCPTCVNKTEKLVADFLKNFFILFISQFKLNSNKRYDFCFSEYKLILEVDGRQHFEQVSTWGCPKVTLQNDIQKMKVALENGYSVLRIYQPDIFNETIDWRQIILDNLFLRELPIIVCKSSIPEIYNNHLYKD